MSWQDDAVALAESVAKAIDRSLPAPRQWRPGIASDDRSPELSRALASLGWGELAQSAELAPMTGPSGLELGRRLAPICDVDALLGASLMVGELVRYGATAGPAVGLDGGHLRRVEILEALPVPYGDSIGVHRIERREPGVFMDGSEARVRLDAWIAASVGYMAGLGEWALDIALKYARGRQAFGATLAALSPVQQRLADAATAVRGVRLMAFDSPDADALQYAAGAAMDAAAACQQVVGAIGFTLEFPLQRAFRRARALESWTSAVVDALPA